MARLQPPDKTAMLALEPFVGLGLASIQQPRHAAELAQAWSALTAQSHVGFDTEARPTFIKGQESSGPDVVQFATASQAFVFQLRHPAVVELVSALLTHAPLTKVGFDLQQDLTQLRRRLGIEVGPLLDLTQVFHRQGYVRTLGIKSAVAIVFGKRLAKSKRVTTSNWANERLEERQVLYAANDAYVALRVWQALGPQAHSLRPVQPQNKPPAPA